MSDTITRLLRWSERYTKTDMVYLVKNSGWLLLGQLAASLSAFFIMTALANMLSTETFGAYRFIIAITVLLSLSTLPGMAAALMQSVARGYDAQLSAVVRYRIKWGLIGSLGAIVLSGYYFWQDNNTLGTSFLIVAATVPFFTSFQSFFFYLQGKQLFNKAAQIQVATLPFLVASMIAVAHFSPLVTSVVAAYMLVSIIIQYTGYRIALHISPNTTKEIDADVPAFGAYLTLYTALPATIVAQAGIIAIWFFLGDLEAAMFAIIMMIPLECSRLGGLLSQLALPKMSTTDVHIPALLLKIFKLQILLGLCFVAYVLIAPAFFALAFPLYSAAVPYSIVAMLALFFVPKGILNTYLSAKKLRREIRFASLSSSILYLVLLAILIPMFGLWGAVATFVISAASEFVILLIILLRLHEL